MQPLARQASLAERACMHGRAKRELICRLAILIELSTHLELSKHAAAREFHSAACGRESI